jgi:hypothetical protein
MANTPPRPPVRERPSQELVEDLCIELRHVACGDYDLPAGERVVAHVREVAAIHQELRSRGVDFRRCLEVLTEETKWQILPLLDDCVAYPKALPYVREMDGIRRTLRCQLCRKAERPVDARLFWYCERCMHTLVEAVRQRSPVQGIVLFRTYNPEFRCSHASGDTVLAADSYIDQLSGVCERCIQEEIERRKRGEPDAAPYSRPPSQLPTSPETPTLGSQRTSSSGGCG